MSIEFRFLGDQIEVDRISVDEKTEQRMRVTLGTIERSKLKPSATLKSSCTPEERSVVVEWIINQKKLANLTLEANARMLPDRISKVAQWLANMDSAPNDGIKSTLNDIRSNWQMLKNTLHEKGFI
ncbi:hypothetical protein [Thiorhodococcus fuscus]|uniref:Uncharacterized protein n=1 Tax=Thiorhodococcus fuscus TaxID=527200 RepID=A0ABW4YE45_9GAMM